MKERKKERKERKKKERKHGTEKKRLEENVVEQTKYIYFIRD